LFVQRVSARGGDFSLSDDDAPIVAEICRKLDGIALAIELAAGKAAIFGLRNTVARLGSHLDLLKLDRRTANPRHQTLIATLDWSHDHLSEVERVLFRRVAIFVGHFTLEAALAVAEDEGVDECEIAEAFGNLVNKSLIGLWTGSRGPFYRLLDTTRAYALEKLAISGEHDSIAERHASLLIRLLEDKPVNLFDLESTEASANGSARLSWKYPRGAGMELWAAWRRRDRNEARGRFNAGISRNIPVDRVPGLGGASDRSSRGSAQKLSPGDGDLRVTVLGPDAFRRE
jgi:predicted ATPase